MKKITYLAKRLGEMRPGDRSWFWYSPDSEELPLLIEKFSNPKGHEQLARLASKLMLPSGSRVCTGIVMVSSSGTLQFCSPQLQEWMLIKLFLWVEKYISQVSDLAYLRDSVFLKVNGSGDILERIEDPELWSDIPRLVRPGSLEEARTELTNLDKGAEIWTWLATKNENPVVAISKLAEDADGARFAELVLAGRKRLGNNKESGLRGITRRLNNNGLLFATPNDIDTMSDVLNNWLAELGSVRLVQLAQGEVVKTRTLGEQSHSTGFQDQVTALEAIKNGETYAFWFTQKAKNGEPLLLLETSSVALKALAMEAATDAPSLRGKVVSAKWGLEFRVKKTIPNFLGSLAGWVSKNHGSAPGLNALVGSRLTVRGPDGEIKQRIKDSDAWSKLQGKG